MGWRRPPLGLAPARQWAGTIVITAAGAAATGAAAVTTGKSPPGLFGENKKAPRERGFCRALKISVGAAASIAPHGAVGTHAAGPHHDNRSRRHDDRGRTNHYGPANRLASAVRAASPAGAASLRGFNRAEAGNGAQGQNCCERYFMLRRPQGRRGPVPSHEQLNGT